MRRNTFVNTKTWIRNPKIVRYYRRIYMGPKVRKLNGVTDGQICEFRFTFSNNRIIQDRLAITSGGEIKIWENNSLMIEIENADRTDKQVTIELIN